MEGSADAQGGAETGFVLAEVVMWLPAAASFGFLRRIS